MRAAARRGDAPDLFGELVWVVTPLSCRAVSDEQRYEQRAFAVPPDGRELIVVRHGASAPHTPGVPFDLVDGHSDPPLSPAGQEQAQLVGRRLAGEPLEAVFVTPLQRTAQTAAPLASAAGLEPQVIADLREVNLGEWEGGEYRVRMAKRDPIAMRALMEQRWDVIPGAETNEHLAERVGRGLETIFAAIPPGGVAAAFLHGGVIGELCRQITRSSTFAFIHADNGSISRIVAFSTGHRLLRNFNDTAHLDGVGA
jgi:2,3-bisphosphoglycerate-dependent phosphoglycerate mutase